MGRRTNVVQPAIVPKKRSPLLFGMNRRSNVTLSPEKNRCSLVRRLIATLDSHCKPFAERVLRLWLYPVQGKLGAAFGRNQMMARFP